MQVLVTGGAGFAGRHFVRALRAAGHHVQDIDLVNKGIDARDWFRYNRRQFDLVIHCAAVVGGRATIEGPPLALASNLELDAGLFQWAARTRPGRVVYISSSAAYPIELQDEPVGFSDPHAADIWPLREDDLKLGDPELPDQLYGWAKLTGEILAARARAEGIPVTIIRPFSGYGEDQHPDYPFRAFAERARKRLDPFEIWGDGRQVRDFIHIFDVVAATLTMAERGIEGPVNLGTGRATSMLELAQMMCREAGYSPEFATKPDAPTGVFYRVANVSKMRDFYQPKISLEEGVRRALRAGQRGNA